MFVFSWTNDFIFFDTVGLNLFNPNINLELSIVFSSFFTLLTSYFFTSHISLFSLFDLFFLFMASDSVIFSFFNFFFVDSLFFFNIFFSSFFWTSSLGWDYNIFFLSNDLYFFFFLMAIFDYAHSIFYTVNFFIVYDSYPFQMLTYLSILPSFLPCALYVYVCGSLSLFILSTYLPRTGFSFYFSRFFFFITSLLIENRLPTALLVPFIFYFFFWFLFLVNFNDFESSIVDSCHSFLIFFFIFLIFFFIWKYSVHFLSFLEATSSENVSVSFFLRQFVRDFSNLLALFLRFFLLLFRLNIYDNLDDFLDSYYVFFCDFDEDSWSEEFVLFIDPASSVENFSDSMLFFKQEWDLSFFSFFYIIWSKFSFFLFFFLEEVFRITLSFYIVYLILFEIHSTNISFSEIKN